jgi:hypothetical protein
MVLASLRGNYCVSKKVVFHVWNLLLNLQTNEAILFFSMLIPILSHQSDNNRLEGKKVYKT